MQTKRNWRRSAAIAGVVVALATGLWLPAAISAPPPDAPTTYHAWFGTQINKKHQLCCSIADGRILRLDQVRQTDQGWEVEVPDTLPQTALMGATNPGTWLRVPPENILYTDNPTGQPVAWFYAGEVRCFVLPPQT